MTNKYIQLLRFHSGYDLPFRAAVLGIASLVNPVNQACAKESRPNIVLILADDMGPGEVSCYWGKDLATPNIDSIGAKGIRCTQAYVSCSICAPSRAGLLTGRYQNSFGFETNPTPEYKAWDLGLGIPHDIPMIQELLKKVGYQTAIVGKWHLGVRPQFHPNNRGFDYYFGFAGGMHDYFPEGNHWWNYGNDVQEQGKKVRNFKYLTEEFTDRCVNFIQKSVKSGGPFFLYAAYNAPHGPEEAPQNYIDRNNSIENLKRRTFAGMISALDDGTGRIMATLKRLGVIDNTIVVFLTDNGVHRTNKSQADPFKGAKGRYEEGGVRMPFLIQWPGRLPAGRDFTFPVFSLDLFKTFAMAAGMKEQDIPHNDGMNLIPYLAGERKDSPRETFCWRHFGQAAILHGKWKLLMESGKWVTLYNLDTDWREQHNLFSEYPKVVEELKKIYKNWESGMIDATIPKTEQEEYGEQRRLWEKGINFELVPPEKRNGL